VMAAESPHQCYNQLSNTPEGVLTTVADAMRLGGSAGRQPQYAVIIAGEHMRTIAQGGWGKKEIRQFLFDHTQNPIAHLKRTNRVPGAVQPADETKMRPLVASPDDFLVIAAGGRAGPFAAHIPGWGGSRSSLAVTKEVKQ
jgi:hypothetical protein